MLYGDSASHATSAPLTVPDAGVPFQQGGVPQDKPSFFSTTPGKLVLAAGAAGVLYFLYKKMSRGGGAAAAPKS